jgi:stage III sporulation protein AE
MLARRSKILLLLIFATFFMLVFCIDGSAEENVTVPPSYNDFIGSIDEDVQDKLPDGVFSDDIDDLSDAANQISSPAQLLGALLEGFGAKLEEILPTTAIIFSLVILAALCYSAASNLAGGLSRTVELCTRLCTFCAVAGIGISCTERLTDYFNRLFYAVSSFLPLSATLYAMGGNVTAAASSTASLGVILTVCQFICSYTVIPVFCVCLCFSVISVFDGQSAAVGSTLGNTVRKWYTTALAFVMMILTTALASQSILSAKADTAAMRGVKFAVSSFVPLSGGTVSSTLGTLAAGVELLRSSVGIIGIIIIILMLVPVIVELALLRLSLSLGAFFAGLMGCPSEQRLLSELSGLYGYLEGVAVLCSVTFLISFGIFAAMATPFS